MKKAMLAIAVLGLAGSLWAADPIIGTWKMNLAKSRFGANPQGPPKEGMEIYRELPGNQIELTYTRTLADGSSAYLASNEILCRPTEPPVYGSFTNLIVRCRLI